MAELESAGARYTESSRAVSRRTVVKGAAWSVPVIAATIAAPRSVASPAGCAPFTFAITPSIPEAPDSQTIVLAGTDDDGNEITVTITSALNATTTIGQERPASPVDDANYPALPYKSYNLSTAGSGWNGGEADDGRWDYQYSGFAPAAGAGAIVLNQRAAVQPEPDGAVPQGPDMQTLTFVFTRNGVSFDPENLRLDIFDITSAYVPARPNTDPGDGSPWHPEAGPLGWRQIYWDAIGFSQPPSSIAFTGTTTGYGQGVGAGTLTDPYHRTEGNQPTEAGSVVSDRFTFASFPSGTTMQYTNHDGRHGWHFVSISGISFDISNCV